MVMCPTCGQANPKGFTYCGACASPLAADGGQPAHEVRKIVTVVFCDMVGSTALGDRSDPERVRALMASYHDLARRVLERHGGTIEKFIGDAVMAVFGVPMLHEDDALRAVRAAVELRDELAAAGIPTRIGVNTGEVVAGGGEALVTGDAVNVAARLEQAAGAGEVLIGEATFRLTRDAVQAEPLDRLVVKGKPQPVAARRLVSVTPGAPGISRRADVALVGRALELSMLAEAFERSISERRCHLFTVMGAPGVGKSRLVAELAAGPAGQANVLVGQCLPYGDGITFWPVAEMLRTAAGIGEREDRAAARAALERLVADDEDGLLVADRAACAIGLGDAPAAVEEVFWAVRRTFEMIAASRPTVLVFEDIHWAEPTLLELIEHIVDWARDAALLVVCTARPDLLDLRPAWAGGKTNASTILLERLAEQECGRLLDALLGDAALTAEQRERVVSASEGNPLFVEQMLAMLSEGDVGGDVPLTMQALLAARLDRLDGDERRVVESASVEGRVFHRSALAALAPDSARPALAAHLERLMRRELIDPDQSMFAGDTAYRFQHVLIRDAAYAALPKRARAELHERFADWLRERVAHRIDEYQEIVAYHHEQAYRLLADVAPDDPRLEAMALRAATQLSSAARHAEKRGDNVTAYAIYRRAIALPQSPSPAAVDLMIDAARSAWHTADQPDQLELAARVLAMAEAIGDEIRALHARVLALDAELMADTTFSTADARAIADRAATRFEAAGDNARLYDALTSSAQTFHHEGRWSRMAEKFSRAEAVARAMGDERRERDAAALRMGCGFWGREPASSGLEQCIEMLERWPAPAVRGHMLSLQARFLALLGRFEEADAVAAEWVAHAERMGDHLSLHSRAFTTGLIALLRRDFERAAAETAWSIERYEEGGQRGLAATMWAFHGEAMTALGRWTEATAAVDRSRALSHPDDMDSEAYWRVVKARVLHHHGDTDEAIRLVSEAIELIDRSDELFFQSRFRLVRASLLTRRGDLAAAREAAEQARELARAKECVPLAAEAEERLAALATASA